jgi:putative flippase GtrA
MDLWRRGRNIGIAFAIQHKTKVRFLFAGALNTAIGLAVFPALYLITDPLKLHYLVILIMSQILCVAFSYLTNKFLVFKTSGNYLNEFGKFLSFHMFYFLANLAALPAMVELWGMDPVWAQTLFAVLVIVTSYFWHSRFTFTSFKVPR